MDKRMRAEPSESRQWTVRMQKLLDAEPGLTWSQIQCPERIRNSPWFSCMTQSQQIALAWTLIKNPNITSADVSQSAGRCFLGKEDSVSTLIPGSKVIMLKLDPPRPLVGLEHMMIQGFPLGLLLRMRPIIFVGIAKLNLMWTSGEDN